MRHAIWNGKLVEVLSFYKVSGWTIYRVKLAGAVHEVCGTHLEF